LLFSNPLRWLAVAGAAFLLWTACAPLRRPASAPAAAPSPAPKPPRVWTLEHPSQPGASEDWWPLFWRRRYEVWASGKLKNYPFEPKDAPPAPFDSTPLGKINRQGEVVTENPTPLPEASIHETEPWGDPGCVWPIRARWSMEWEERFSNWIQTSVDANFLARHNIAVDCADAPYALRWIFARMHGLPQGAHNVDGAVFGNWNTRFADLPTSDVWAGDQRFRAALEYVLDKYVQGRSIPYDAYPIALMPEAAALRPGTVVADKTHVRIIHRIDPGAYRPIRHLSATVPSKVRALADEALSAAIPNDGVGWGIVNWSWWDYDFARHRYRCVPDRMMPGFSLEQYEPGLHELPAGRIHLAYQGAGRRATPTEGRKVLREMIADLVETLRVRREVVDDGWAYYANRPRDRDKKTRAYDDFSTPARDARLRRKVREIEEQTQSHGLSPEQLGEEMAKIEIPIAAGRTISLRTFVERLMEGKASPQPWDPPYRRWGFDAPFVEQTP